MKIVLIGQPNSGKSTIFNWIGGYKSATANFPGTTVNFTTAKARISGWQVELVDLPGIYSLTATDAATTAALNYLLETANPESNNGTSTEILVNIVDASRLSRALELTLQLLELGRPLVLCLNMMDEARRRGLRIDIPKLASMLGVPIVATVASKGQGVIELMQKVRQAARPPNSITPPPLLPPIQQAVANIAQSLDGELGVLEKPIGSMKFPGRFLILKLIENDPTFVALAKQALPQNCAEKLLAETSQQRRLIQTSTGRAAEIMVAEDRADRSKRIFQNCTEVGRPEFGWRDRLDDILMHPVWGYVWLALILYIFFNIIFKIGAMLEPELLGWFGKSNSYILSRLGENTFGATVLSGILQGLGAGVGIVLPYLVPFLLGMAFLEDVGYLPRVAFLMDGLMQRIGLHGTSVFPAILGYGCSVPAVMATRILRSPRDRFIAAMLAIMAPCSARTTVILGLVAFYLSPNAALAIYGLNIVIIALAGKVLAKIWPEITPGLVMEIPPYRVPATKLLLAKTWWRLKEFIVLAWPMLIAGSIVLSVAEAWQLDHKINAVLRPLTSILGLPSAVGTTLIFGVMRKELSLMMLMHALGTTDVTTAMTPVQIGVFTLFVVFYIPCLATITVLWKEIGKQRTILAIALTLILAVGISLLGRFVPWILGLH
ncbi:MAG: ferrous iron transport protein B [candidate division KSB1 bacterium]|nr:ferrous iron transport protein B [candidate division KSB1 bacterium]MDZ7305222.1 ferrous iron transport protein B [candidate division KSB1 bacterium]